MSYYLNSNSYKKLKANNTANFMLVKTRPAFKYFISFSNNATGNIRYSDRRLKKDIAYLSTLENGIRLYSFRYTWSNDFTYVGVMAQDLLLSPFHKDAVTLEKNSFYSVDYSRLGLKMITLSEWQQSHNNILIQSAEREGEIEAA